MDMQNQQFQISDATHRESACRRSVEIFRDIVISAHYVRGALSQ